MSHDEYDKCVKSAYPLPFCAEKDWFIVQSCSNGHCLFHSIHICLFSICKTVGITPYTSEELLSGVLNTFLDDNNKLAQSQLKGWVDILKSCKKVRNERIQALEKKYTSIINAFDLKNWDFILQNLNSSQILEGSHESDSCLKHIRTLLKSPILDEDRIEHWIHEWRDKMEETIEDEYESLRQDLVHVESLLPCKEDSNGLFPLEARKKLVEHLKNPNVFWGEEYTLRTLQERLKIKFIILKPSHSNRKKEICLIPQYLMESHAFETDYYILLFFTGNHYQPIVKQVKTKKGQIGYLSCFEKHQLPHFVLQTKTQ